MIKITIECAVFCYDQGRLKVLLSKENNNANTSWGILTGMLERDESADDTATRVMQQYGAEKNILLRQLGAFMDPNEQGSDQNVTIGYYGLINIDKYKTFFGAGQNYRRWWKVTDVPDLMLNYNKIIDLSLYQIGNALRESAVGFELLPEEFTLFELTNLYKEVVCVEDESVFCQKIVQKKIIVSCPAQKISSENQRRYKFNAIGYERLAMQKHNSIF